MTESDRKIARALLDAAARSKPRISERRRATHTTSGAVPRVISDRELRLRARIDKLADERDRLRRRVAALEAKLEKAA